MHAATQVASSRVNKSGHAQFILQVLHLILFCLLFIYSPKTLTEPQMQMIISAKSAKRAFLSLRLLTFGHGATQAKASILRIDE